ncbi:hypothetical protein ACSSS7_005876 [Eimeria intestinalis]
MTPDGSKRGIAAKTPGNTPANTGSRRRPAARAVEQVAQHPGRQQSGNNRAAGREQQQGSSKTAAEWRKQRQDRSSTGRRRQQQQDTSTAAGTAARRQQQQSSTSRATAETESDQCGVGIARSPLACRS